MTGILIEARQAGRQLIRDRGFAIIAWLTLSLGIGASTAIFSVVDRLLIRPLAFPAADQLVRITVDHEARATRDVGIDVPTLIDLAARHDLFAGVSGLFPINSNFTGSDEPERVEAQLVSASFFDLLGVHAQIGRTFAEGDAQPGIATVAVISDGLWMRRFNRDPSVIGRAIRLDNDLFTIVGVMPAEFRHPGQGISGQAEVWVPSGYSATPFDDPTRSINILSGALARLSSGVSPTTAQAALDRMSADLVRTNRDAYPKELGWRLRLTTLQDDMVGDIRPALILLMAAVGLMLLMGCANLTNLLIARVDRRSTDMAVRLALGATRLQIAKLSMLEQAWLAVAGAIGGCLLALWMLQGLAVLSTVDLTLAGPLMIEWRAVSFATMVSVSCCLLLGMLPSWQAGRASLVTVAGRVSRDSPARRRLRLALVAAQCAAAVVLLVGASLVARSVSALLAVNAGFDERGLLTARFWMPQPNDPSTGPYFTHGPRMRFYRELLNRVAAIPGIEAAGITSALPLIDRRSLQGVSIEGRNEGSVDAVTAQQSMIGPGYLEAMRIGVVRGRPFSDSDDSERPGVALVNETFARRFLPGDDPIGRRIRPASRQARADWLTIVGVVRDVRSDGLDREVPPQVYRSLLQSSSLQFGLVLRGRSEDPTLSSLIAREVREIDRDLPLYAPTLMSSVIEQSLGQRRLAMQGLAIFAAAALLTAGVGLYGVMSYVVGLRKRELAIRVAIGAAPRDLRRIVLTSGSIVALAGISVGLIAAAALSGWLRSLLYGIEPINTTSYLAPAALLAAVALAACWWPARRAAATDPLQALRGD